MKFKDQFVEWDVDSKIGIPVGYSMDLSIFRGLNPRMYTISTNNEIAPSKDTFYYSLDAGSTWNDFALGEQGQSFLTPYKMKARINNIRAGFVIIEKDGVFYQVSPDLLEIIQDFTIDGLGNATKIEVHENVLYAFNGAGLYKFRLDGTKITPMIPSIQFPTDTFSFTYDKSRKSFWQIGKKQVSLRDENGNYLKNFVLPFNILSGFSSSLSNSKIISLVNKSNGNICFSAIEETSGEYYVIECNRFNGGITYAISDYEVTGICLGGATSYLFSQRREKIGKYFGGAISQDYIDTTGCSIDLIVNGKDGEYFSWDGNREILTKFTLPFSEVSQISLPVSYGEESIFYREADHSILYSDNDGVFVVRDDGGEFVIVNSVKIGGGGKTLFSSCDFFGEACVFYLIGGECHDALAHG